jgi:hypothetical protein
MINETLKVKRQIDAPAHSDAPAKVLLR